MPNQYTPYQNGTFEGTTGVLLQVYDHNKTGPGSWSPALLGNFGFSTEQAKQGTKSFKFTAPGEIFGSETHDSIYSNVFYSGPAITGNPNKIALDPSKKYRISCWVYTPVAAQIASPGAMIGLFDHNFLIGTFGTDVLYETLMDGRIRAYRDLDNPTMPSTWPFFEFIIVPVSVAAGQWCKVEALITGHAAVSLGLTVWTWKFNYRTSVGDGPWVLDLTEGGTVQNNILEDGEVFVDSFEIFPVVECDLTPGTPAYSKTNETSPGANNGTITSIFTSSYTMEYSLDDATYQLSPTFTALPPDNYTLYVRDSAGCTAIVEDIIISPGVDPPDPPDPPAGPIEVDMHSLVAYNFIHWFPAVGPFSTFTGWKCLNRDWGIPKGYVVNDKSCPLYYPIAVPTESFSFYANFNVPINDPNYPDYRLGLLNGAGVVSADIGALSWHNVLDPTDAVIGRNMYATTVTVPPGTRKGLYTMAVYNINTGAVYMVSNQIQVVLATDAEKFTTLMWYRHNQTVYKYYWNSMPSDWLYKIRLRLYRVDQQFEGNLTQYRATSTGKLRNVSFDLDKMIKLESYFFNDAGHDAMGVWQAFLVKYLNEKPFELKGIYKQDFDPARDCYKGTIEVYDQEFSTANRYGSPGNIIIIPPTDPLLLGDGGTFIKL